MHLRMGVIIALVLAAVGCGGTKTTTDQSAALVGKWTTTYSVGGTTGQATVTYRADGSCESSSTFSGVEYRLVGNWTTSGDVIHYTTTSCSVIQDAGAPAPCSFGFKDMQFKLNGDQLELTELQTDGAVIATNTYTRTK